jgi:protein-tyrosine kinase
MESRIGLIERAAALLREGGQETPTAPAAPTTSIERAATLLRERGQENPAAPTASDARPVSSEARLPPGAPVAPLRQSVVLDRNHLARTGIMMPWTATARVVEEFRIVKRNIMARWQSPDYPRAANRPPRVVMVTSSRPREGKTFCSINLALAFAAEENLTTILLDADALHGGVAKLLQLPPQPGFTDLLIRERRLDEVLVQTDLANLVVLPPGPPGPHVPELLHGKGPSLVFKEIARRYPEHVIVMDTTPCLASTDPAGFAPLTSHIVFVVEAGHTQQTEVESSLSLLGGGGQVSFLLNKVPVGSSEHFGSYSYYYDNASKP